jgi:hypothetical protein
MKTLKLKCTEEFEGRLSLQHPMATPGFDGRVQTYAITEIPDKTPAHEVIRLANLTVFRRSIKLQESMEDLFDNTEFLWTYKFDELAPELALTVVTLA